MTRPNERARAWAWHTALWAATAVTIYATIWLAVAAIHAFGQVVGLTLLVVAVVAVIGTASWWQAGKTRP